MNLKTKIEEGIKQAMLAKDSDRLRALRGIKSQILLAETEKGAKVLIYNGKNLVGSGASDSKGNYKIYIKNQ